MFKFSFNPDPLFYTVNFTPRVIKATEKQILAIYNAGAHGLTKDDEISIAVGMQVNEYRLLCESDPVAAVAAKAGYVHGKLEFTQGMMKQAREGDVKALAFILTHIYGMMPAKPDNTEDKTVTIRVLNAEIADDIDA